MFVNNERVHFLNTPSHDSCLHIPYDILSLSNFSGPTPLRKCTLSLFTNIGITPKHMD